jgi:acetate kinase
MTCSTILALNVGSSNVKAAVFRGGREIARERFGRGDASMWPFLVAVHPDAVGHRVVHGGIRFVKPVRMLPAVLAALDQLAPLAPLHLPPAVATIRGVEQHLPGVPQVACFDTAFHATLEALETHYGLPRRFHAAGVRKYGFHGLSYQSIADQLPLVSSRAAEGRTVVCHLGSGASVCGMSAGRSIATSMGFSPLDGLLMATRCGRIDPGAVLHLLQHAGMTAERVAHLLEQESGLLGVSGVTGDMQALLADPAPEAAFAVQLFCRMAAKEIAAVLVPLCGLDCLVFTGGIGEHAAAVRAGIVAQLAWLGLVLDPVANGAHARVLHAPDSPILVFCLPTDEELVIAECVADLLP